MTMKTSPSLRSGDFGKKIVVGTKEHERGRRRENKKDDETPL